jgi:hypothetical protein
LRYLFRTRGGAVLRGLLIGMPFLFLEGLISGEEMFSGPTRARLHGRPCSEGVTVIFPSVIWRFRCSPATLAILRPSATLRVGVVIRDLSEDTFRAQYGKTDGRYTVRTTAPIIACSLFEWARVEYAQSLPPVGPPLALALKLD